MEIVCFCCSYLNYRVQLQTLRGCYVHPNDHAQNVVMNFASCYMVHFQYAANRDKALKVGFLSETI